ncbi:methyltransferase domain-containing protein [bacterium]|nr:methyltransferase domain-containing protein [bacterium]
MMLDTIVSFIEKVVEKHRQRSTVEVVNHLGHSFKIDPQVFSPFIAPSGYLSFSLVAQPIFFGKHVLDVGCGAGIFASLTAASGATRVVGVDINPVAVENARRNALSLEVDSLVEVRTGDLFEPILDDEAFDIIFADLPFTSGEPRDLLDRAFYDPDLTAIRRFLREVPEILARASPGARAFLCLSDFEPLEADEMNTQGFIRSRVYLSIHLPEVTLNLYELTLEV